MMVKQKLEIEVMKLRGIIVDVEQNRKPYDEKKRVVCVPASVMLPLVQEARDILLQGKRYDGQIDEGDYALLTGKRFDALKEGG